MAGYYTSNFILNVHIYHMEQSKTKYSIKKSYTLKEVI